MLNTIRNKPPFPPAPVMRFVGLVSFLSIFSLTTLSGCGGGAENQSKPVPANKNEQPINTGSLQSNDVKAFKKEVWEKLSPPLVCGGCHRKDPELASSQPPYFTDWLDVNYAYNEIVKGQLVDLVNPANSKLVQRVANGHQCWLGSASLCEMAMIQYIEAWANSSQKGTTLEEFKINPLSESQIRDPSQSRFFPVSAPASYASVHTLVTSYCSTCHVNTAINAQSPFFAETDIAASYQAIKTVLNLNDPAASRIYRRLVDDSHNCWDDCTNNAADMLTAINNLATSIPISEFTGETVSKALTLSEGTVASSHNRYESDQIALYEFKSGATNPNSDTLLDTSGVEPPLNLTLMDKNHRWLNNWGIEFTNSQGAYASVDDSHKLYNLIRLTGEYTLEAWVIPANVNQENASIVAYSGGADARNFALGQTMYNYDFFQRSSTLGADGEPKLMTNNDDEDLQATLQHVVVTYNRDSGRRIYVNGEFTGDIDPEEKGDFLNWHRSYTLYFGNEVNGRAWNGILRMVAIHDRALSTTQIQQNYAAEVGQKYQIPFSVSHILDDGVPHSYVVYEVSQFDEFSYLFRNPRFINLDPDNLDYVPPTTALRGIRIGMNGQNVSVGQAYTNVSINDVSQAYSSKTGLILSNIDTVIQIQNGVSDEFFLTFEQFAGKSYSFIDNDQTSIPPLPIVPAENKPSNIGIRTFDEINASMAQMTHISDWQEVTDINRVYTTYRQQLPAVENIESFLSSQQMAIAQLAMSYCNELVIRDEANSPKYFTGFTYTLAGVAFDTPTKVNQIINPLLAKMLNVGDNTVDISDLNLTSQPAVSEIRNELNWLINGDGTPARTGMLTSPCDGTCNTTERTQQVVKAACTAVLGSATMLIQ